MKFFINLSLIFLFLISTLLPENIAANLSRRREFFEQSYVIRVIIIQKIIDVRAFQRSVEIVISSCPYSERSRFPSKSVYSRMLLPIPIGVARSYWGVDRLMISAATRTATLSKFTLTYSRLLPLPTRPSHRLSKQQRRPKS